MRVFSNTRLRTSAVLIYPDTNGRYETQLDIITCDYPPSVGGLADHTHRVVEGLQRSGIRTHVWALDTEGTDSESADAVTRPLGRFGLHRLLLNDRLMGKAKNRYLLLQWHSPGYGFKSLNLPFCLWIASRVLRGSRLLVMFHNSLPPHGRVFHKRAPSGILQRLMAFTLVNCAETTLVSDSNSTKALQKLCINGDKVRQLPVFSNVESGIKPDEAVLARARFASEGEVLIGHFGRYHESVALMVLPTLAKLMQKNSRVKTLFMGECGARYRAALVSTVPELESRVIDSGARSSSDIASFLSACDFMFQPYPNGISTKCGSVMAALANGKAVLSTYGPATEDVWRECGGVHLLTKTHPTEMAEQSNRLVGEPEWIKRACAAASPFYKKNFLIDRTIEVILDYIQPSCGPIRRMIEVL